MFQPTENNTFLEIKVGSVQIIDFQPSSMYFSNVTQICTLGRQVKLICQYFLKQISYLVFIKYQKALAYCSFQGNVFKLLHLSDRQTKT